MDREVMLRAVQMLALETLVQWLLAEYFRSQADPAKAAAEFLSRAETIEGEMTFPDLPPEWSDLFAQELREALSRRIALARDLVLPG